MAQQWPESSENVPAFGTPPVARTFEEQPAPPKPPFWRLRNIVVLLVILAVAGVWAYTSILNPPQSETVVTQVTPQNGFDHYYYASKGGVWVGVTNTVTVPFDGTDITKVTVTVGNDARDSVDVDASQFTMITTNNIAVAPMQLSGVYATVQNAVIAHTSVTKGNKAYGLVLFQLPKGETTKVVEWHSGDTIIRVDLTATKAG